ncbi:MAG: ABC transporter ATP-binding protein [Gammaproteobacteria bacterium]|nr:ABC transporter ATP-binding protein [Gammaproteobacteria bacterium]MCZ6912264.1 ABC transporter ATP-binding protein [Pseudomonadota bacterium]
MSVLNVSRLKVSYPSRDGVFDVVRGLSFELDEADSLGIAGESGSGKSQTALAIMGLLPDNARVSGSIRLDGQELLGESEQDLDRLRGKSLAMVFQDPLSALNPYMTVGRQIGEVLELHQGMSAKEAARRSCELLQMTGIDEPGRRSKAYPHQFSGGQRQRILIAMALACGPRLLIADEPTTALDVTVQKKILELLRSLCQETGTALILISHDLAVLSGMCRNLMIMYGGMEMERGLSEQVLLQATHPYTAALLRTLEDLHGGAGPLSVIPGEPPDMRNPPGGCPFHPRCTEVMPHCSEVIPRPRPVKRIAGAQSQWVACHLEPEQ